jgi:hypothetical protein
MGANFFILDILPRFGLPMAIQALFTVGFNILLGFVTVIQHGKALSNHISVTLPFHHRAAELAHTLRLHSFCDESGCKVFKAPIRLRSFWNLYHATPL